MTRNFFISVLLLLGLFFSIGLASCREEIPDLPKKERDPRLLGLWTRVEEDEDILPSEARTLEFKLPGYCISLGVGISSIPRRTITSLSSSLLRHLSTPAGLTNTITWLRKISSTFGQIRLICLPGSIRSQ